MGSKIAFHAAHPSAAHRSMAPVVKNRRQNLAAGTREARALPCVAQPIVQSKWHWKTKIASAN
jgi:hypothetical protein